MILVLIALNSCVQQPRNVNIRFSVDMRVEANVDKVGVIGMWEPLSWDTPVELADPDNDGIYQAEVTCKVYYNYMQFKFVKNGDEIELDGLGNRSVEIIGDDDINYHGIFDVSSTTERSAQ